MKQKTNLELRELGRGLIESDKEIAGVKIVVFYDDGELDEYSSKRDLSLPDKYRK